MKLGILYSRPTLEQLSALLINLIKNKIEADKISEIQKNIKSNDSFYFIEKSIKQLIDKKEQEANYQAQHNDSSDNTNQQTNFVSGNQDSDDVAHGSCLGSDS